MRFPITDLRVLAVRVEELEASNRRWKLFSMGLLLSGISVLLIAAKTTDRVESSVIRVKTVEARDIILKDEHGNVCARLSVLPIIKRMSNGVPLIFQSDTTDRAVLVIYNDKGRPVWTAPPSPTLVPAR